MTTREIGIQAIKDEAEALLDMIPKMDEEFDKAVELMLGCKGTLGAITISNCLAFCTVA